jgi:cbb3-type cytochrome oxidase maturation protein
MILVTIITLVCTLLLGALFFVLFCWGVKDGQFSDVEEAKYQLFREDD